MIARILKDKGIHEYIKAIEIIKKKYFNVEFQLLGASDSKNNTAISKIEIDSWTEKGFINYLGTTDDVPFYISNSNCVVLPSYREGVSRSLLEAAAMERPLIATNVPGCKEVVDDNKNGFLCKVKDSKDLADKMEKMLNLSENERINMGKEGRNKIIREFDEKFVIDKYIKNIQEVLSE
jgi:glycosyltransferase involved in cell wall biosynthesis